MVRSTLSKWPKYETVKVQKVRVTLDKKRQKRTFFKFKSLDFRRRKKTKRILKKSKDDEHRESESTQEERSHIQKKEEEVKGLEFRV